MRSFASRDVVGVVVLLVLFLLAILLLAGSDRGGDREVGLDMTPDASIYNDRASGTQGLYEWCASLGYRTRPWRQDWTSLPADAAVLVCTAPRWSAGAGLVAEPGEEEPSYESGLGALTPSDARGVRAWLSGGHTLILMASQLPPNHLTEVSGDGDDEPGTFSDILGVGTQNALVDVNRRDFAPLQPLADTAAVGAISLSKRAGGQRLVLAAHNFITLFGDVADRPQRSEPVAIQYAVGKGTVIAIADGYFADNENLPRADNALFLAGVLRAAAGPGGTVLFDEFHHGDIGASRGLWDALGRPLQLGVAQLCLAMLVLAIVLGARFGLPVPLRRTTGHSSGEYVTSLAALYRSAGATVPALETVYRQFLRDVCARLALPPDISLQGLADAAARRGTLDRNTLRQVLSACERHLDRQQVSEGELIALVQQMERFRRQLGITGG